MPGTGGLGDFFRPADAAERDLGSHVVEHGLLMDRGDESEESRRLRGSRSQDVDADVAAL